MIEKNNWFKLNKGCRIFLFIYLGIILILSIAASIYMIFDFEWIASKIGLEKFAVLGCVIFCLFGSSSFYIRKLYKSCINLDVLSPVTEEDRIRQGGVVFYFVLRPIFSAGFGILLFLAFKVGFNSIVKEYTLSNGFIYTSMFVSFFVGYKIGDVIDHFEEAGKKIVKNAFKID